MSKYKIIEENEKKELEISFARDLAFWEWNEENGICVDTYGSPVIAWDDISILIDFCHRVLNRRAKRP